MQSNVKLYLYGSRPVVDTSGQKRMRSSEVCVSVRASGDTLPSCSYSISEQINFHSRTNLII